ncbi:iron ABC transporter permease [Prolixibacteraceae bacterium JC049]|nr:iron ABC transporter permease [Prolixibacteraceae bacterium JC049]
MPVFNRNRWLFVGLVLLTILAFVLDVIWGSVNISLDEIFAILAGEERSASHVYILNNFRIPKALTALVTGAGLALSGLQMQTLFRNPLAGPFVLGISSGAGLGVAMFVMAGALFSGFALASSTWGIVLFAIIGSALVMFMVVAVSLRVSDSVSLLIIGIMFGSVSGALVSILQYFSDPITTHSFLVWTFGSLSGVTWNKLSVLLPMVGLGAGITFFLQKSLNALLLGENQALTIGVDVKKVRLWVIVSTCLMAGTITAFTGPIAFLGVAVPHMARTIFRTSDHKTTIWASVIMGMLLMLICDLISQMPGLHSTLPINSVTALFGAPVVIWIIIKSRNVKASFS